MLAPKTLFLPWLALLLAILPAPRLSAQANTDLTPGTNPTDTSSPEFWFGILDAELRKFRFALRLDRDGGEWKGELTSLDEGDRKFPLDGLVRSESELSFDIKISSGRFEGQLDETGRKAVGKWKQGGAELDLVLERVAVIPQEDLKALWSGELSVLFQKLQLSIRELNNGEVLLDSVTQKAGGFVAKLKRDGDQIVIDVPALKAEFSGTMNAEETEIVGKWKQNFLTLDLTFKKSAEERITYQKPNRPQTPKPPFPYKVTEVRFENADAGIQLAGTLTQPEQTLPSGGSPAVVLISGSGPQDRDESIVDHQPFWVLADHLTRNGIAVLRFDDRGVGKSQGDFSTATSVDFASDVAAAVSFLRQQAGINPKQIGLCGHSEGGIIAPIAAVDDPQIAFIILMAGTGVNGEKILVSQARLILQATGADETVIDRETKLQRVLIDLGKQRPTLSKEAYVEQARVATADLLTPEEKEQAESILQSAAAQILSPWFQFFMTYEPAEALAKVNCPVLAVTGSKDLQVDPDLNMPAIEAALEQAGNQDFRIVVLPGLNHLFQACQTGSVTEYQEIEETINPEALNLITDWIKDHTR
jgi:pimeloyl-ACP methyl ester carboxylesterase